jgi:hypothetical protein
VAIIFQTTYDIAEAIQPTTGPWNDETLPPDGDGIGWWQDIPARRDRVHADGNMSAGGGGRGFRHVVGDGTNQNGGGSTLTFTQSASEIWIRFYVRFPLGFAWDGSAHQKLLYGNIDNANWYHGWNFNYMGGHAENDSGFGTTSGNHRAQDSGDWASYTLLEYTWQDMMGGDTGDGLWHCWELHLKMNPLGSVADGIWEMWVDNTRVYYADTIRFATSNGEVWTGFHLGSNQADPLNGGDVFVDFDDVKVSNSERVGPLSVSSQTMGNRGGLRRGRVGLLR